MKKKTTAKPVASELAQASEPQASESQPSNRTEVLDPGQLAAAERIEPAYRHPESARTVAYHHDGHAYTITGLLCGKADAST